MTPLSKESQERVDEYLTRLEESLASLPEEERSDAVEELRTHIEEGVARIREDEAAAVSTVLRGLGDPAQYAAGLIAEDTDQAAPAEAQPGAPRAKRTSSAGWCIAGCIGLPVVLLVLAVGLYLVAATAKETARRRAPVATVSAPSSAAERDPELRALQQKLLSTLTHRDAAGMARLRHPDLIAERGVSGEDLLLPGAASPEVVAASRVGPDDIRISVRADDTVCEYRFEKRAGQWLVRDVRESARETAVSGAESSPEVSEPPAPN
jgi:hypothetical protein